MTYTPSTYSVESAYCHAQQETLQERGPDAHTKFHAEFRAWLTAYTNQVKAQALEDAARELDHLAIDFTINRQNYAAANDDPKTVIALASVTVRNLKDTQ